MKFQMCRIGVAQTGGNTVFSEAEFKEYVESILERNYRGTQSKAEVTKFYPDSFEFKICDRLGVMNYVALLPLQQIWVSDMEERNGKDRSDG